MSWKERTRVDERVVLVGEYVKGERSMAELCREFAISRKTGYKWVARYNAEGPATPTPMGATWQFVAGPDGSSGTVEATLIYGLSVPSLTRNRERIRRTVRH